jgi:hypothetical protein
MIEIFPQSSFFTDFTKVCKSNSELSRLTKIDDIYFKTLNISFKRTYSVIAISLSKKITYRRNSTPVSCAHWQKTFLDLKDYLIKKILNDRLQARRRILKFLKKIKDRDKQLKEFLIKCIINERIRAAALIQSMYRMHLTKKHIQEILHIKINDYILFYNSESSRQIELKIYKKQDYKTFSFKFSKQLNIYYLVLKDIRVLKKRYRVNFVFDGKVIIDPRYIVDCYAGKFYNIINASMFQKGRQRNSKQAIYKSWEKVFEITVSEKDTNSVSDISEPPDIDKVLKRVYRAPCKKRCPTKPILKLTTRKVMKTVSFSDQDIIFQY